MPNYSYKAARKDGSLVEGSLEAATEALAARGVRNQGLLLLSIGSHGVVVADTSGASLSYKQVLSFTGEFAVLLRAGLPIDRALKVLIDMSADSASRALLEDMLATVKSGKGLSHAMQAHGGMFDEFYISMIRSGEASGNLADILTRLAAQLERAKEVRSNVVSALIYPAILALVAVISVTLMLGFVVPQFEELFADMGQALPVLTQIVVSAGNVIKDWGLLIIVIAIGVVFVARQWLATVEGRDWFDHKMLQFPILGGVVLKYEIARFSRTLGTLLGSGVSLLQALNISVGTVTNGEVKKALVVLAPEVKRGGPISHALAEANLFSPMMIQMIRVGEESGQLDQMLLELARVYDDEVAAGVKRSLTLLEPVLILLMGGMIGVIIVAILMGILSVNDLAV